jgi:tRNA(Arg) A34 adenosine deaminase TadA
MPENFEKQVEHQIERLKSLSLPELERQVARKRIEWASQNLPAASLPAHPSPRQAFETLFFTYMGLPESELPVLSETDDEIAWRSLNPCPTLEAAGRLGLDTRRVCRAAYEKSTQAFLSQLDPQLRFLRSYAEIRPYAEHCREMIVRLDFEELMRLAIAEARASRQEGNKGYGALVVCGHEIIGKAHDTAATEGDPSLHAEVNAIRQAVCSSLAVWANLTSMVYGASIEETAKLGKSRIRISAKEIVERSPVMIEVVGGVLAEECRSLYA